MSVRAFQSLWIPSSRLATGGQNTAVGDNALGNVTTGVLNTAVGDLAGDSIAEAKRSIPYWRVCGWRSRREQHHPHRRQLADWGRRIAVFYRRHPLSFTPLALAIPSLPSTH